MSFPTEQRFKILQQSIDDAEQIASFPPQSRPQMLPVQIVGYGTRSDGTGQYLKVAPVAPTTVSSAGELTFPSGSGQLPPTNAYYIKVFPIDCSPANVQAKYQVGSVIFIFPFYGAGSAADIVRGTMVCTQGGGGGTIVRLTSSTGTGGQYQGYIQLGAATDHTLTTGLSDGAMCIVINAPERGTTSSVPMIQDFSDFKCDGTISGTDANTGFPIVLISSFQAGSCQIPSNGSGSGSGS